MRRSRLNLVFNSAPLLDVIPSFADALGFNFLADSDLKGVVTLNIDQKMTRRELWNTFDKMLNLSGAGVTVEGTLLRIMALPKVARRGLPPREGRYRRAVLLSAEKHDCERGCEPGQAVCRK